MVTGTAKGRPTSLRSASEHKSKLPVTLVERRSLLLVPTASVSVPLLTVYSVRRTAPSVRSMCQAGIPVYVWR